MASFGQPAQAGAWARVQLVRGSSGGQHWAIDAQYPQARLTIGSAPDAGWPVQAPAVRPYHFEFFWDGQSLWVADTQRVGGVTLNGRPVSDWTQVRGQAQVAFGAALMQVETSAAEPTGMVSNPDVAARVTLAPGEGMLVAQPAGEVPWDDGPLDGEATRIVSAPSEGGEEWSELAGESTRIAPEGAFGMPMPPATPQQGAAPMMRPRLGGGGGAPAIADARPMARTMEAEELAHQLAEVRGAPPPPPGVPQPPSVVVQPGYPKAPGAPGASQSGGFSPVAPTGQSGGFSPVAPAGQSGGFSPLQPQALGGFGAPGAPSPFDAPQGAPGAPQSGFMAPPSFDQAAQAQSVGGKGKQALPMRTWALLSVTVLAAVGLMMMGPSEEEAPPATPPQAGAAPAQLPQQGAVPGQPGVPGQPVPGQPVPDQAAAGQVAPGQPVPGAVASPGQPVPDPANPVPGPTEVGASGQDVPGSAAAAAQPAPAGTPGAPEAPTGPTPDRLAADLVINGRFAEALPRYQELAQQHPERPEYAQMVRILQRRLRCQGGVGRGGRPCTP